MVIFELIVPYEKNVHQYHLVIDLLNIGFKVTFYATEIVSRGLISIDNSDSMPFAMLFLALNSSRF